MVNTAEHHQISLQTFQTKPNVNLSSVKRREFPTSVHSMPDTLTSMYFSYRSVANTTGILNLFLDIWGCPFSAVKQDR